LTKGILRSLWSVRLLTYHGASAVARSVFDWNLWMMLNECIRCNKSNYPEPTLWDTDKRISSVCLHSQGAPPNSESNDRLNPIQYPSYKICITPLNTSQYCDILDYGAV
jgi:hypothetical protein